MKTKRCFKCKVVKPLAEYANNGRSADGKKGTCKLCLNLKSRERYHAPNSKQKINQKQYQLENKNKIAAVRQAKRAEHREKLSDQYIKCLITESDITPVMILKRRLKVQMVRNAAVECSSHVLRYERHKRAVVAASKTDRFLSAKAKRVVYLATYKNIKESNRLKRLRRVLINKCRGNKYYNVAHREELKLLTLKIQRLGCKACSDTYIKNLLCSRYKITPTAITQSMIEVKRLHLLTSRELKKVA